MKCPKCHEDLVGRMRQCNACGHRVEIDGKDNPSERNASINPAEPTAGFKRTLSTDWAEKQAGLRMAAEFNELMESRTYLPGETIIEKGDTNRDLYFLTEGLVEISTENPDGDLILNTINPPYLLGDIAFLSGFPRTATAKAKTKVELFILKYENLMSLISEFPAWFRPLLTAFSSSIKSLHFQNSEMKKEMDKLKATMQASEKGIEAMK